MKRKGFTFLECILAIGILSIIAVSILPIISTSSKQFSSIGVKNELRNIGQSTIEILKSTNELSIQILEELETKDELVVNASYIKENYECIVKKIGDSENLIDVEVRALYYKDEEVEDIVLKATIKK